MSPPIPLLEPLLITRIPPAGRPPCTPFSDSPPPLPLRDPNTGNTIWPPISRTTSADLLRQRLKLARIQFAHQRTVFLSKLDEEEAAKAEGRYQGLHAARLALKQKRDEERRDRQRQSDPFARWDAPTVLPDYMFYRPPVPACVAVLAGVPVTAWRFGAVAMAHPLFRVGPQRVVMPLFAGEVFASGTADMSVMDRWDPRARMERTERFDAARLARATAVSARDGKRDKRERCLRCRLDGGAPCSLERRRNRGAKQCERCRRNGCAYCLRVADPKKGRAADDKGPEPRYRYFRLKKARGCRKVDLLLYVRDEAPGIDTDDVRRYAEELVAGNMSSLWGESLDANHRVSLMLPSWKDAYGKTMAQKRRLDDEFVARWSAYGEVGEGTKADEGEKGDPVWQDYFELLAVKWAVAHPYMSRDLQRRRLLDDPTRGEAIRK